MDNVEEIEFIDCGSLNISYDATGKASVSFNVVKNNGETSLDRYTNPEWGGVNFDLMVLNSNQKALIGSRGWYEWSLQLAGVGNNRSNDRMANFFAMFRR